MTLSDVIADEIGIAGPMRFSRFMELALYHPSLGYYCSGRDPFGRAGDFYTNSQLQPVFGRLVAQVVDRWRQELGADGEFEVTELGPGRGETAAVARRCAPDVSWVEVEAGQRWPDRPVTGVVFCNEFFDALPVDVVERGSRGWLERRVGLSRGRFVWEPSVPCEERTGLPRIAPGRRIETCDRQVETLRRISGALTRGWILVIDYGYTRDEVERGGRFPDGSLMGYSRHRADPDVLKEPGFRDITAHVNFSAIRDAGTAAGLEVGPLLTQQQFLLRAGEEDEFAYALAASDERRRTGLRLQLKSLLFGLGETFRVLVLRKR